MLAWTSAYIDRSSVLVLDIRLLFLLVYILLLMVAPADAETVRETGVVVESVGAGSALEKAGIQPGDIILSWERLPSPPANPDSARGQIESYFDWLRLEFEQAPRGAVELAVQRDRQAEVFVVKPGLWEADVRPIFPESIDRTFKDSAERLRVGDLETARRKLNYLDGLVVEEEWKFWILLKIGRILTENNNWEEAQGWFRLALESADSPVAKVTASAALGHSYEIGNEPELARQCYTTVYMKLLESGDESLLLARSLSALGKLDLAYGRLAPASFNINRALEIRRRLAPESLEVATSLRNLGSLFQEQGELAKAQKFFMQALHIEMRLASGSLNVAYTANNLGNVARMNGDLQKANEYLEQAEQIKLRLIPDSLSLANTLSNLGNVSLGMGDFEKGHGYYKRALVIRERLSPGGLGVASVLENIGWLKLLLGDLLSAEEHFLQSLSIRQRLAANSLKVARTLNKLGLVARRKGDLESALGYHQEALEMQELEAPESLDVATTLSNLGTIATMKGELLIAQKHLSQSLSIRLRRAPDTIFVARNLSGLGEIELRLGNLVGARDNFLRAHSIIQRISPRGLDAAMNLHDLGSVALESRYLDSASAYLNNANELIRQIAPDSLEAARILDSLGHLAYLRGDLRRSEELYYRSYELKQEQMPQGLSVAVSLNNLGLVNQEMEDLGQAKVYYSQSLRIKELIVPGSYLVSSGLTNLGSIALKENNLKQAEEYLEKSLDILERTASEGYGMANNLTEMGILAQRLGDYELAKIRHKRAIQIAEKIGVAGLVVAVNHYWLSQVFLAKGQKNSAVASLLASLEALEINRSRFGGSYEIRTNLSVDLVVYYKSTLDILLEEEQNSMGFHVLERSRARTFLEMLAERELVFAADIPDYLDDKRRQIAVLRDRKLQRLQGLNPRDHEAKVQKIYLDLERLQREAGDIEEKIRRESPKLTALKYPQPLDAETTRQALDPGTLLLSYSVGNDITTLFTLSRDGELRVDRIPLGEEALREQVREFRRLIYESRSDTSLGRWRFRQFFHTSWQLYDALIEPVADRIDSSERLLILPDRPLHTLPFAALVRGEVTESERPSYLIEWKPLHIALSATVYDELKKNRRDGSTASPAAPDHIVAFGDPHYPQIFAAEEELAAKIPNDPVVRSVVQRRIFDWQELPYTRNEVDGIEALYPQGTVRSFLGQEALEEAVKDLGSGTRILHFAAHGHIDQHRPLESFIALTIPDKLSKNQENGLLQVWEILEQVRIDADLVVLSACESGLGVEQGSEGLIGLVRAFHYAGARSVLATLWNVADQTTAELMVRFHSHLKAGLSKDEALRSAQLELIRGPIALSTGDGKQIELVSCAENNFTLSGFSGEI